MSLVEKVDKANKIKMPKKPWMINQESNMSLFKRMRDTETA